MGCSDLWKLLSANDLIESRKGGTRGDYELILKEIQGKILAVDVSVWLMEIKSVSGIRNHVRTETAAYLKVIFEKLANMMRLGCTPVLVLEGEVDESKYELMERRYQRAYTKKKPRNRFGEIEKLASALGVCTVRAPGEGEAMCAALDSLALVNGCVTRDSDAFAFGAQIVYKTLSISSRVVKQNTLEVSRLIRARELFGICSGGMMAMRLLTVLSGGDYNIGGTQNVGGVKALATVQALLKDKLDDSDLIDNFWAGLFSEATPTSNSPPTKSCTGCRTCGCPSGSKTGRRDQHGRSGCFGCGTQSVDDGGNGDGGCLPLKEGERCRCAHCLWKQGDEGKREQMDKVFESARRQSIKHTTLSNALQTYERQRNQALSTATTITDKVDLMRKHRPDTQALIDLMEKHLEWAADTTREKLLPLLLEWDASHRYHSDTEFVVVKIISLGTRGRQHGNQHSEVIVQFERKEDVGSERVKFDKEWLQRKAEGGRWGLMKKLVDENYPDLIRSFKNKGRKTKTNVKLSNLKITDFLLATSTKTNNPQVLLQQELGKGVQEQQSEGRLTDPEEELSRNPTKMMRKDVDYDQLDSRTSPMPDAFFTRGIKDPVRQLTNRSSRRRPYVANKALQRIADRTREDIRCYCSPTKRTTQKQEKKNTVPEHGRLQEFEDSESCSVKKFGSVPRRFSSLSIASPERRIANTCVQDWKQRPLKSLWGTETKEHETNQPGGRVLSRYEVVDLLTPKASAEDERAESVIDLLSDASPVMKP